MKGNRFSDTVKEYARKLCDDDIRYLNLRLTQRIGPDVAEATEFIQRDGVLDNWLSQAKGADDFFDMIDVVDQVLQTEIKRRFTSHDIPKEKFRS